MPAFIFLSPIFLSCLKSSMACLKSAGCADSEKDPVGPSNLAGCLFAHPTVCSGQVRIGSSASRFERPAAT